MTKWVRVVTLVLFAGLLSASVFGFLAQRSLDDSDGFAESMSSALADPAVKAELQSSVRTSVLDAVQELGDSGGLFGSLLAGVGAESLADVAARAVATTAFEEAWHDWALLLHQGLADFAVGQPNSHVDVTDQYLEIQIGPLVTPLLGTGLAATFSEPIDTLIGDRSVVVDTGEDMESRLRLLGVFADARWIFAAGAVLTLALTVFMGPQRVRWLALSSAAAATGLAILTVVLTLGDLANPNSTTPALDEAIRDALLGDWTLLVGVSVALLVAVAVGLALLSRSDSLDGAVPQNSI